MAVSSSLVLVAYLGMGTLPIAIIGGVIAITMFFSEKRVIDLKNSLAANPNTVSNDEEDFF